MIPDPDPGREVLGELIALAERRFGRAQERLRAAQREADDAGTARAAAHENLVRWHAAHPDLQLTIFEGESDV